MKHLLIFIVSLAIYWLAAPLRGDSVSIAGLAGFPLSLVVGSILYYIATLFFLRKYKGTIPPWAIVLTLTLPLLLMELPVRIGSFEGTAVSLPDSVLKLLSILFGWACFKIKPLGWKIVFSVVALAAWLWVAYSGYDLWMNRLSHGTFTGHVSEPTTGQPLEFRNEEGAPVRLSDLPADYVILDFWYSGCGGCFTAFPQVQELHEKHLQNDRVALYGVFCRQETETDSMGHETLAERGYTFPCLSIDMSHPALKELGVDRFPTVLIFNRERDLVFRGDIKLVEKFMAEEL